MAHIGEECGFRLTGLQRFLSGIFQLFLLFPDQLQLKVHGNGKDDRYHRQRDQDIRQHVFFLHEGMNRLRMPVGIDEQSAVPENLRGGEEVHLPPLQHECGKYHRHHEIKGHAALVAAAVQKQEGEYAEEYKNNGDHDAVPVPTGAPCIQNQPQGQKCRSPAQNGIADRQADDQVDKACDGADGKASHGKNPEDAYTQIRSGIDGRGKRFSGKWHGTLLLLSSL